MEQQQTTPSTYSNQITSIHTSNFDWKNPILYKYGHSLIKRKIDRLFQDIDRIYFFNNYVYKAYMENGFTLYLLYKFLDGWMRNDDQYCIYFLAKSKVLHIEKKETEFIHRLLEKENLITPYQWSLTIEQFMNTSFKKIYFNTVRILHFENYMLNHYQYQPIIFPQSFHNILKRPSFFIYEHIYNNLSSLLDYWNEHKIILSSRMTIGTFYIPIKHLFLYYFIQHYDKYKEYMFFQCVFHVQCLEDIFSSIVLKICQQWKREIEETHEDNKIFDTRQLSGSGILFHHFPSIFTTNIINTLSIQEIKSFLTIAYYKNYLTFCEYTPFGKYQSYNVIKKDIIQYLDNPEKKHIIMDFFIHCNSQVISNAIKENDHEMIQYHIHQKTFNIIDFNKYYLKELLISYSIECFKVYIHFLIQKYPHYASIVFRYLQQIVFDYEMYNIFYLDVLFTPNIIDTTLLLSMIFYYPQFFQYYPQSKQMFLFKIDKISRKTDERCIITYENVDSYVLCKSNVPHVTSFDAFCQLQIHKPCCPYCRMEFQECIYQNK